MQDEFTRLARTVLDTFGKPVIITRIDNSSFETIGVIKKELMATGQFENLIEEVFTLTLDETIDLNRGDKITSVGKEWIVDRKLKSDDYLGKWNIHEY